jgi:hypothetical protein
MIQFLCDSCRAVKQPEDAWILGRAAEAIAMTAARREVTLFPAWDRDRAVHPYAVHFCSVECKNNYMERLFGPDAAGDGVTDEIIVERTVPAATVVERRAPVKERVITKAEPRRRRPQKKSA